VTTVYKSDDGTVYDSTDGWRIESYGNDSARSGGTQREDEASGRTARARRALARMSRPSQTRIGPNGGGVADSLDEAKARSGRRGASAFRRGSGRDMRSAVRIP
jgi:hypothetical protein